ncbi:unnamed protein product [Boreogadus saida]
MAAPLARDTLPDQWSYGVCRDGRVFFINDKTRSTTWLHPRTAEPVNSGHMIRSDLPRGWEEGFTDEGASYFINHTQRSTSFRHPVTGQISPENTEYTLQDRIESRMSKQLANQRTPSVVSQSSTGDPSPAVDTAPGSRNLRASGKVHSFGKRDHAIKRNLNVPVVVRGWLYKQDSSGMRLWKRKWFVLSDFCLFYYKDSREETVLGSIPLPSYVITPVDPDDHISRKYAFKASHTGMRSYIYNKNSVIGSQAEHCGMRTYFFSADTQEDLNGWTRAMNQAARMQQSHAVKRELERPEKAAAAVQQQAVPQSHHSGGGMQTPGQRDAPPHRAQREEPQDNGVRLAPGEEVRYGLEIHGRPPQPATGEEGRVDGRSPDPGPGPGPRNGHLTVAHVSLPSEANGNAGYKRAPGPRMSTEKEVQRKTALAQVEHWVKVQKGDPPMSAPSAEYHLPRRTPPTKPRANGGAADPSLPSLPSLPCLPSPSYLSLPKSAAAHLPPSASSPPAASQLTSDYKYAHDRLSHFCMSTDERTATKEGMVWQLYEWQQRQQFRHGSPTAPIYTPGPGFLDASAFRVTVEMPRSVSVPPSPSDLQPPPPPRVPASFKPLSPRRPHTPLGRVTVKPLDDGAVAPPPGDSTMSHSPRSVCAPLSQMERRSMPAMGYITHTVSAPSLHGKTPEELTLLLIQLRRHQAKMAGVLSPADDFAPLPPLQQNGLLGPSLQADDTYIQLKKDLDYLDLKLEIRCFLSEPELLGIGGNSSHIGTTTLARDGGYQTLPSRGMSGSSSMVNQSSNISSYVTIRRAASAVGWAERPQSALERLYSGEPALQQHQQRGKMSADEQLERMKRHQKALVRQRKRTLSHGDARAHGSASRAASSSSASTQRPLSADLGSWRREQEFDLQLLERAVQGEEARGEEEWEPERRSVQGEEGRPEEHQERPRSRSDEWLTFRAPEPLATAGTPPHRLEPLEYDLDLSKELSTPQKVLIPERYVDSEPEETLSPQEVEERHRKVERIKSILAKSSVQNLALAVAMDKKPEVGGLGGLDSALQEQERIITMSYALASEASLKSKQVTAQAVSRQ